jgi:hypothetical protein
MNLIDLYKESLAGRGDIFEHLPVLYKYGSLVNHITELGTKCGNSTTAFLLSKPAVIRTYDFKRHTRILRLEAAAEEAGIDFLFEEKDVRTIQIEPTELLFIDTWHCYDQMKIELMEHADKASRFLIMHDTETFGIHGENAPVGIWPAVSEYMREHPEWELHEHRQNNNGLTVFRRV